MLEIVAAVVGFIGLVIMAIIGWAFSITNRVSVLEADKTSLKEFISIQFEDLKNRLDKLEEKIERKRGPIQVE